MQRDSVTWSGYLSLALFTFFLNIQGNILPFLRDEFGLSYRLVTLHPAAIALGLILSGLVSERPITILGRKRAMIIGLSGLIVGALCVILAPSPVISIGGCLLMGFLGGLILAIVPAMLVQWHRGAAPSALGEANGISYMASLVAALSTGLAVALHFSWRTGLGVGVVLAILLILAMRPVKLPLPLSQTPGASGRLPLTYWLYWLALTGFIGIEQATLVWAPEFLETGSGLPRASAAIAAGAFSAGMLVGRMSATPLMKRMSPMMALYGSLMLALPAFFIYWSAPWPPLAVAALFALGLGTALLYPLTLAQAIALSGPLGDVASARASLASGFSILVFPSGVGALADWLGLWPALLSLPILGVFALFFLIAGRIELRRAAA
ncbi:MFS transporter [Consotaella salsifontis]|uniref:Fucose permease n=1 Tax=Consotaella salsifontis TaxID=1365950 RepID=A0A1T4L5T4_9HYPH|nr:MFS transporter [Consotaella salsifontis]SJZ49901.1 Fucose permease [Consotaella salsifontis]